ncbi:MAG: 50S ribosomal protein L5 [Candidatus Marinimicrobia bacterium]|nr:50S ribosomal protein L5 [Candidatus Neomarinimicrobiota bacterium]RKY61811.1 MAG: 50S ribosomal protein L5 [Candidatus Neomarinimicrobiota bacterium]
MAKKVEYRPRLLELYETTIVPAMIKKFGYKNTMEVPRLQKISLNIGVGKAKEEPNALKNAQEDIRIITGQQPVVTHAKKAISNFKIRKGDPVGCSVTLRRHKMYEFLDRLISVALPRVRDFSGLPDKAFDGRGNYNMGIKEQIIFPEIDYDKVDKIRGMNITMTTSAKTDAEARELLALFGFPFKKRPVKAETAEEKS